jgi:hypothetical protein
LDNNRKKCRIGSTRKGEHSDLEAKLNRELQHMREDGAMINGHTLIAQAHARKRNMWQNFSKGST